MPQFLVPFIASVGAAVGGLSGAFLIMNASLVANGLVLLGGLALSSSAQKSAKRKAREQYNAAQVDRIANISSTVAPRELVLGRVRKGGSVFYRASTGSNKATFVMLVALAGHEIDAVEQIYLNDQAVTLDGSGNVQEAPYVITSSITATVTADGAGIATLPHTPIAGSVYANIGTVSGPDGDVVNVAASVSGLTVTTSPGASVVYQYASNGSHANIRAVLGTDDQAADAALMALLPSAWTAAHRARAVAYLVCTFQYSETAFPNGLPVVSAVIRGAKVYDPRQNRCVYTQDFANVAWQAITTKRVTANTTAAPDGTVTADTLEDANAAAFEGVFQSLVIPNDALTRCFSIHVRKTTGGTAPTFGVNLVCAGGTGVSRTIRLNTDTGATAGSATGGVIDAGDYWRLWSTVTNNSTGNTTFNIGLYPATSAYGGGASDVVTATGSAVIWGAQLVEGAVPIAYTPAQASPVTPVTAWSQNPALQLRHVYQHPQFGKATVSAEEDDRIIVAANACDISTDYLVDGVTDTQVRYRAALAVPFGAAARDVMDDLAQAMGGSWAFAGGELYLRAGVWTEPVIALTDADLAVIERNGTTESQRPISISVHRERAQRFNSVNVTMWDQAQSYKQVTLTPLTSSALVTRDGATLAQAITYSAIGYAPQALHVAGLMMRDARDPLTVVLPFKLKAYPVEVFDNVTLTLSRYGWSAKEFMVMAREWTQDGRLQLTLKETAESIYTLDAEFSAQGGAPNTSIPSPWYVPPVGPLTIASGTSELVRQADGTVKSRMRVSWPALNDASVTDGGSVEVQYRDVLSTGEWTSVQISGNESQAVITDVQDSVYYLVRARARNRLAIGDWSVQVQHQVLGKTEAPPDVDSLAINGLVLTWPPVDALDLAGYRLRAIPGTTANWAGGFALHEGIITDPPYTLTASLGGLYCYMVVAVDTSGNESAMPASISASSAYTLAGNTLESWPQAPLFEGTKVAGTVSGGLLVADSTGTLFWGADSNLHWTTDASLYWGATSYSAMVYTFGIGPSSAGLLVLESEIAGDVVSVDMRRGSVSSFWSSDAAAFWTSDPAAFWSPITAAWAPWPGALEVVAGEYIEIRVTTSSGATQGVITTLTPYLDVPTVEDYVDNAVVSAAGTRLPLGKAFRAIKNIQLTVQQDGGSAVTARWVDKLATGPLVQALDITGTPVASTVDAYLKGY
jgi:hypothetical protein